MEIDTAEHSGLRRGEHTEQNWDDQLQEAIGKSSGSSIGPPERRIETHGHARLHTRATWQWQRTYSRPNKTGVHGHRRPSQRPSPGQQRRRRPYPAIHHSQMAAQKPTGIPHLLMPLEFRWVRPGYAGTDRSRRRSGPNGARLI